MSLGLETHNNQLFCLFFFPFLARDFLDGAAEQHDLQENLEVL